MKLKFNQICKRALSLCVAVGMLCSVQPVYAANDIMVFVDGEYLSADVPPYTKNGYTMLPMRAVYESLGAEVVYEKTNKQITAYSGQQIITLFIDKKVAYVNGSAIPLSAAPEIKDGRTMVGLRDGATLIGADIEWDSVSRTVNVWTDDAYYDDSHYEDEWYEEEYWDEDIYDEDIYDEDIDDEDIFDEDIDDEDIDDTNIFDEDIFIEEPYFNDGPYFDDEPYFDDNLCEDGHTKGIFLFTDSEHPHYNYYECEICYEEFAPGSKSTVNSCTICNPVETGYWSDWSGWSTKKVTASDTRKVETREVKVSDAYTQYRYGRYVDSTGTHDCWCSKYFKSLSYSGITLQYSDWSKTRYSTKGSDWTCGYCSGSHIGVHHTSSDGRDWWREYNVGGDSYYWEESRTVAAKYEPQYRYSDWIE